MLFRSLTNVGSDIQGQIDGKMTTTTYDSDSNGVIDNGALDSDLNSLAGLAHSDGNFIVSDGLQWKVENTDTARTSLGLGTAATKDSGTLSGQVLEITTDNKLPALDGSSLTSLNGGQVGSGINASNITTGTFDTSLIDDDDISGDKIHGGEISNFKSKGIDDNADDASPAMTISNTENIGIGTTSPGARLDVNGTARLSNRLAARQKLNGKIGRAHV